MHDFQLISWRDSVVEPYCSCGWLGDLVVFKRASPTPTLAEARDSWLEHVKNAPRTFDNQVRQAF